jgi:hypothetical protein
MSAPTARWIAIRAILFPQPSRAERFWSFVDKRPDGGCWLWTGAVSWDGYGAFRGPNGTIRAHRFAWTLTNGQIPNGLLLRHACDVPKCVNPDHLSTGTAKDNHEDWVARGRKSRPQPLPKHRSKRGAAGRRMAPRRAAEKPVFSGG